MVELTDDERKAFLIGVYEGVMSDSTGEQDLVTDTNKELLLDRYRAFKRGDWDFPEGHELLE